MLTQTDPVQQFVDVIAVTFQRLARNPQRQGNVVIDTHMVDQAEVLKHHAEARADQRFLVAGQLAGVPAEDLQPPLAGLEAEKHQPQQGGLARPAGTSDKAEAAAGHLQRYVPQHA